MKIKCGLRECLTEFATDFADEVCRGRSLCVFGSHGVSSVGLLVVGIAQGLVLAEVVDVGLWR